MVPGWLAAAGVQMLWGDLVLKVHVLTVPTEDPSLPWGNIYSTPPLPTASPLPDSTGAIGEDSVWALPSLCSRGTCVAHTLGILNP